LAVARALLSRPRLLLLDEPTLGLAPLIVDRVFETLQELNREGVTILLVEQNAARTIEVADRTYVMRSGGRIAFHGTQEELAEVGQSYTPSVGRDPAGRSPDVRSPPLQPRPSSRCPRPVGRRLLRLRRRCRSLSH